MLLEEELPTVSVVEAECDIVRVPLEPERVTLRDALVSVNVCDAVTLPLGAARDKESLSDCTGDADAVRDTRGEVPVSVIVTVDTDMCRDREGVFLPLARVFESVGLLLSNVLLVSLEGEKLVVLSRLGVAVNVASTEFLVLEVDPVLDKVGLETVADATLTVLAVTKGVSVVVSVRPRDCDDDFVGAVRVGEEDRDILELAVSVADPPAAVIDSLEVLEDEGDTVGDSEGVALGVAGDAVASTVVLRESLLEIS